MTQSFSVSIGFNIISRNATEMESKSELSRKHHHPRIISGLEWLNIYGLG